ncbi:hypothetical protein B0H19DRAFT_1066665 [Mycena capillaripes]|nr:hypothetical protein B0H19DRAFT_1066665 [Mycena capillaripes]
MNPRRDVNTWENERFSYHVEGGQNDTIYNSFDGLARNPALPTAATYISGDKFLKGRPIEWILLCSRVAHLATPSWQQVQEPDFGPVWLVASRIARACDLLLRWRAESTALIFRDSGKRVGCRQRNEIQDMPSLRFGNEARAGDELSSNDTCITLISVTTSERTPVVTGIRGSSNLPGWLQSILVSNYGSNV